MNEYRRFLPGPILRNGDARAGEKRLDGQRVLVVDDDRLIREMTRRSRPGASALPPPRPAAEALSRPRMKARSISWITDPSMREMDGMELLERIKRARRTPRSSCSRLCPLESALQAMRLAPPTPAQARLGARDHVRRETDPLRRRLIDENECRGCIQAFEAARPLARARERRRRRSPSTSSCA
jgi:CheY-like chemotaxis protein